MYNPGSDKRLWFASPASQFEGAVCTLDGERGGLLYNYNTPNTNDLRPVVCLPSSIEIRLVS